MTSPTEAPGRATVVGTGLIGASLGLALRDRGWEVAGTDRDPARAERAKELGALDDVGLDLTADVTFVATPVGAVADAAREVLGLNEVGLVTDVGSVKAPIVNAVDHPRFIGGHPMAGSEQEGVEGADGSLFEGATWVLTPTQETDPAHFARLQGVIASLGANVVALAPEAHDALVAVVSHVPHLAAASLMRLAAGRAEEHVALLRLAAGGFRDMTRVAAGHPGIWPDICAENRDAIVGALDQLMEELRAVRDVVAAADRERLLGILQEARVARTNLPSRAVRPEDLAEVRVPVPDRPGVIAEVSTLASEVGVNIYDVEIAHSAEGDRGVLVMLVDAGQAEVFRGALMARRFRPSTRALA